MDSDEATQATRSRPSGMINETFPYKVCINLDRRLERWHHARRRFEEHGIQSVRRFPAFDGDRTKIPSNWVHTPGAYGCLLSHVAVVREARRRTSGALDAAGRGADWGRSVKEGDTNPVDGLLLFMTAVDEALLKGETRDAETAFARHLGRPAERAAARAQMR